MVLKVASDWEARVTFGEAGAFERRLEVTPALMDWSYLSFRTYTFRSGESLPGESAEDEMAMVLLSGALTMEIAGPGGSERWELRSRDDVFSGAPAALYLPPHHTYRMTVHTDSDCAYGRAPASGTRRPRLVTPEETVEVEVDGAPVRVILSPESTERLVCYERVTPAGGWSDLAPHRHDGDGEVNEVAYHRMANAAWGVRRLYDEGSEGAAVVVRNGDAVPIRSEYRPLGASPSGPIYSLHFVAGETARLPW